MKITPTDGIPLLNFFSMKAILKVVQMAIR